MYKRQFLDRVIHRTELRAEIAGILKYLVPAGFEMPAAESSNGPAFRPLSFLSALAERVSPESEPAAAEPVTTAAVPNGPGDREAGRG